ncbi:prohead protease/major capsid protein fusion protein [Arachidicoccus terrestris]|uniref:prohead protease/major capsid protein fusion protein n=1 Tax=Arachidicoccus terrestris TaxID=2875539 RepID=UPI001CC58A0D|nr:prohead protease/major capsid protein fusion protein [Arachidicoccus terrestris]UAY56259.1 Mu-like prophage major head subunit gpT family protein [Arachidicoccus terrestris]
MKANKKIQEGRFFSRAMVDSNSIIDTDDEKSFEVVFATETPVFRRGWDEKFNEILVCNKSNIRAGRLDAGVIPLLNGHDRWDGVNGQLGALDSWYIKDHECRAKILFSTRQEFAGIWGDIKAGIIRSISSGYNVYKYIRTAPEKEGGVATYKATDWEPLEISLEPVPADFNSKVRKTEDAEHEILIENFLLNNKSRSNMENETVVEPQGAAPTEQPATRSEQTPPAAVEKPVTAQPTAEQVRSEAVQSERKRTSDIMSAVRAAKLDDKFAAKLIEDGTSIENARTAIIDKLAEQDTTPIGGPSARLRGDEADQTRAAMSDAIMSRVQPGSVKEMSETAQDYRHSSMVDIARRCLEMKGERSGRYSPSEVITRAIATTDYPLILGTTVQRFLRKFYEAQNFDWKKLASSVPATDFRQRNGLSVSGKVTFEEIAEGGEYKEASVLTEENASIKLKTYGKKISIPRQAMINDDLRVFSYLPSIIAQGAANFQADKVWALITGNAKTPDGKVMFEAASHKNLGAAAALNEDSLSTARTAMFRQTTPSKDFMPIQAKYLVVPPELQTTAEKLMTAILANATGSVNVFANKFELVIDPRLTDPKGWYLAADPETLQGIVYAYLQGEEGLHIESKVNFNDDSVVTKARLDFDCNVWDYRPWYKNPGA